MDLDENTPPYVLPLSSRTRTDCLERMAFSRPPHHDVLVLGNRFEEEERIKHYVNNYLFQYLVKIYSSENMIFNNT